MVSVIGGRTWAPIHRFCERARVPCLFPDLDLPVVAEQDFYPVYFSRGVLLEAQLACASPSPRGGGWWPRAATGATGRPARPVQRRPARSTP
ncbi:MAG TPA: hypothetical protein VLD85_14915 [Anaeromyxobacteraceae bacterium]|nr:hypothetical protein [Anaeromyxobacteraceae bacterium]